MINHKWILKEIDNELDARSLADSLNVSEILARLLVLRNIRSYAQAKAFFRPTLANLHNPSLMDGMDIATHRVVKAIVGNEKILIYGDYDVDGTCATAMMLLFLRSLKADVDYYIPKRLEDGYGISNSGIDFAKSKGISLMISVDCGVTAVAETDYANSLGIDLIICDHHQSKEQLPNAFAVLDPIKPNCQYPFKYLSGAGVAFKLIEGICGIIGKTGSNNSYFQYLDLVALAGAADIVPLEDENRVLVREGLLMINSRPRPGVEALIKSAHLTPGQLTSSQIVFTLAPRINAVGRMQDASIAVELMITDDPKRAETLASELEWENSERKKIDDETLQDALRIIENNDTFEDEKVIVLHDDNWHAGVIGIVASRIVEKFYKPTVMLTTSTVKTMQESKQLSRLERIHRRTHIRSRSQRRLSVGSRYQNSVVKGSKFRNRFLTLERALYKTIISPAVEIERRYAHGSARSINNFNIYEALRVCEDMLIHFGGHEAAAGLAVEITKLDEFKKRLNEIVTEQINDEIAQPKIMVDSKIRLTEITPKFMRILDQFSPFGPGNMRPIFWASELEVAGKARAVGAGGKHLMMSVRQNGQKRVFDAIGFDLGEYAAELNSSGCMFDMLFSLEQKIIDKKEFPQLRIRDLHFNKRSGV